MHWKCNGGKVWSFSHSNGANLTIFSKTIDTRVTCPPCNKKISKWSRKSWELNTYYWRTQKTHVNWHTCRTTDEVMNPKAYSPIRGCLIMATSLKACVFWSAIGGYVSIITLQLKAISWKYVWNWKSIRHTWRYGRTNLLWSIIYMPNKWHSFDEPFPKTQNGSPQPWWHEHPDQKNESDWSHKSKTWSEQP